MTSPWKLGWLNPNTMSCTGPIAIMTPLPDPQDQPRQELPGIPPDWPVASVWLLSHHSTPWRGAFHPPRGVKDAGRRGARSGHFLPRNGTAASSAGWSDRYARRVRSVRVAWGWPALRSTFTDTRCSGTFIERSAGAGRWSWNARAVGPDGAAARSGQASEVLGGRVVVAGERPADRSPLPWRHVRGTWRCPVRRAGERIIGAGPPGPDARRQPVRRCCPGGVRASARPAPALRFRGVSSPSA